ncbi:MAG: cytochrome-c peroxidase [Janthinobacterium lividum]
MSLRSTCFSASALLLAGALAFTSCSHHEDAIDEPVPAATPYTLTVPAGFPTPIASPDNPLTVEGVALGRMLFYEKALSSTGTMACASCHQQSKAFTDGLPLAVGVDGIANPRGTMSLVNLAWSKQFTWDGAFTTLEEQALKPIQNSVELHQSLTMGVAKLQATSTYPAKFLAAFGTKTITPDLTLKALSQFERTLISGNSRYDQYRIAPVGFTADERAGLFLYSNHIVPGIRAAECFHCHSQPLMSSSYDGKFFNNGLDLTFTDLGRGGVTGLAADNGKFIAPSLRNIALTAPYMHDGRFKTLEEVLDHYSDHVQMNSPGLDPNLVLGLNNPLFGTGHMDLTAAEKKQIIAFLNTLTDTDFVTNKNFSSPF